VKEVNLSSLITASTGRALFSVNGDVVVTALKRFKGIAKQDLLIDDTVPNCEFYRRQALSRRRTYDEITDVVISDGVEAAVEYAVERYLDLPVIMPNDFTQPELRGVERALEFCFQVFGFDKKTLRSLKTQRFASRQTSQTTMPYESVTHKTRANIT
jgi:hypothetical protein